MPVTKTDRDTAQLEPAATRTREGARRAPRLPVFLVFVFVAAAFVGLPATLRAQAPSVAGSAWRTLTGGAAVTSVVLDADAHWTVGSDSETGTARLEAAGLDGSLVSLRLSRGSRSWTRIPRGQAPADSAGRRSRGQRADTDGVPHAVAIHNSFTPAAWFFPALGPLAAAASDPAASVQDLGATTLDGVMREHLVVTRTEAGQSPAIQALVARLSRCDLYLDPATLLPAVLQFKSHPDQNLNQDIRMEIRFSDYRAVNGIQVPYHIEQWVEGVPRLSLDVTDVHLDGAVPPGDFLLSGNGGAQ